MSIAAIRKLNEEGIKCMVLTKGLLPELLAELSAGNEYGVTLILLDEDFRSWRAGDESYQQLQSARYKVLHQGRYVEEVISHLTSVDGWQVEVLLELNANSPNGLSPQIVRTISENCRVLKVKDFGFKE